MKHCAIEYHTGSLACYTVPYIYFLFQEYFFRASLCHLCIDALNAQHAIEKYGELYPAFGDSRYLLVSRCKGFLGLESGQTALKYRR